jgi:hypothetical protein
LNDKATANESKNDASEPLVEASDIETVPTSAADVESAGRSCLVILILFSAILVLFAIWLVVWSSA